MGIKDNMLGKLSLMTKNGNKEYRLKFSGYKNFLRLHIFYTERNPDNLAELKVNQFVGSIPINRTGLNIIVNELSKLNTKEEGYVAGLNVYKPIWEDNKMTDERVLAGRIFVGRKKLEEGIINFIGVSINIAGEDKKFVFKLLPSPYLEIIVNGKKVSEEMASMMWTDAYYRTLVDVLSNLPEVLEDDEQQSKNKKSSDVKTTTGDELVF